MEIYLDNAATTKPLTEISDLLKTYLEKGWYNPSSLYKPAVQAHGMLGGVRKQVLESLHAVSGELMFTSGGTEGNNTAIAACTRRKGHIVISEIEHPSVYETVKQLEREGYLVDTVSPRADYTVDAADVVAAIREDTLFVSIMHVNNETGAINDIAGIARAVKQTNERTVFHSDGVQAFMKIPVNLSAAPVDFYTVSAHKIHALKGTGALYAARKGLIKPYLTGGGQEGGLRSGTENTLGISAFGLAQRNFADNFESYTQKMYALRQRLAEGFASMPDVCMNSAPINCSAPHILNVSFLGVRGEVLLHVLENEGIYVGTGSACSSKKNVGSRILKAMGFDKERLEGAVRISLSPFNTENDIDMALQKIADHLQILRKFKRR